MDIIRYLKKADTNKQIIMFPFAGGSAYSYRAITDRLRSDIEVIALEPPGQDFKADHANTLFREIADVYLKALLPLFKKDFLLFGHSMGGIFAFEICKAIEQIVRVKSLVITGSNAPCSISRDRKLRSTMTNPELVKMCFEIGGIDSVVLNEPELLDFFCLKLQVDLSILERYIPAGNGLKIKTSTSVFSGSDDFVSCNNMFLWSHFVEKLTLKEFPGNHFFIFDPETIDQIVLELETRVLSPPIEMLSSY